MMKSHAHGGNPMVQELFPILATHDLSRALAFYRDLLGGTVRYEFPGPNGTPAYVGLDIGGSSLGLGLDPAVQPADRPRSISLWVYVTDCDAAIQRLRDGGVTVTQVPTDEPWGERVARVLDPDGNEVIIGAR